MSSVFIMDSANEIAKRAVAAREAGNIELAEKLDARWRVEYYRAAHYWDVNSAFAGGRRMPFEMAEQVMNEEIAKRKNELH